MTDEDSITLTMQEYGDLQSDMLKFKHENEKLKGLADKYQELLYISDDPYTDIIAFKESDPLPKAFPRDKAIDCLKSVRK
jgi:hypothetical protein